jgi:hypothetical protein
MLLLGLAFLAAPGTAAFIGLIAFKVHPLAAAVPFIVLDTALTIGVAAISGGLYANFNPSE